MVFLVFELLNWVVVFWVVWGCEYCYLMLWVLMLYLYFLLGCFVVWKVIYEVVRKLFYWDKIQYGFFDVVIDMFVVLVMVEVILILLYGVVKFVVVL